MKQDLAHMVELAIQDNPDLDGLGTVVEKEILHYDILHGLQKGGYLGRLVFIGGTALRLCHGARRFSEDLDFDGGTGFTIAQMRGLEGYLQGYLSDRYGRAMVSPPKRLIEDGDQAVGTWRISIVTQPERRDIPHQRIHLDIAAMPGHAARPMQLKRNYRALPDGCGNMVIQARTKNGILADKLVAFPATLDRRNLRWRDLWDMHWLARNGAVVDARLVQDRVQAQQVVDYPDRLAAATRRIPELIGFDGFIRQLSRFLDKETAAATVFRPEWRECAAHDLQTLLGGLLPLLTAKGVFLPPEEVRQAKPLEDTSESGIPGTGFPDPYAPPTPWDSNMKK